MPEKKQIKKQQKKAPTKKSTSTVKAKLAAAVYDIKGLKKGKLELPKEIFDAKVNKALLAQAIRVYLANQKKGTSSTKTRGEVVGSTRKIYRQKGTGRARHGALTAPIFVGGGVAFGPKPRDMSLKFPKKMKQQALFSALTLKQKEEKVNVLDISSQCKGKTREIAGLFKKLGFTNKNVTQKSLLVISKGNENVKKAARNIPGITIVGSNNLSTYQVVRNENILFVKDSVDSLKEIFLKEKPKN